MRCSDHDGRRRARLATGSILGGACALLTASGAMGLLAGPVSAATPTTPDVPAAVRYVATFTSANGITDGTSLAADGYYDEATDPNTADFGLTLDGAFGLAAAGSDNAVLAKVVTFIDSGTDGAGRSVADWTGTAPADEVDGTYPDAESGAVGKEALLAEMVGDNPRSFGRQNLIALLDSEVCTAASNGSATPYCGGRGNYDNADSTFDQALGIMAQLRAGDTAHAAAPVSFLESQQETSGGWPQLLPSSGSPDVDSTGMAVMALALASGKTAAADVSRGEAWLAAQQTSNGGFDGASGDSTNSAALAIMGLNLDHARYTTQISKGLSFLASEQNSDGGFDIAEGDTGSDMRASTQVLSGIIGTSFGTVSDDLKVRS